MINAAIVGLGWWGGIIHRQLASSDVIRPVLGVEPAEAARQTAEAAGLETTARFEDALERNDIQAVILTTPHKHHAAQIIAAAKAGKHVFCEKPLCTSAREMEAVAAAVTAAKVQLGIGHERRFEPGIIDLRARLAAGELGTALLVEGNFSQDKFLALPPDNWRLSALDAPVGPLSATGIHIVDLSIALLGKPKEVWARLATRGSPFANGDTLGVMIAFKIGRHRPAHGNPGNLLHGPHCSSTARKGGSRSAIARIPSTPPGGMSASRSAAGLQPHVPSAPSSGARQSRGLRASRRRGGALPG